MRTGRDSANADAGRAVRQPPLVPLRSGAGAGLVAATVLASMAGFLDASVVNVAVPAIGRELGRSLVALQWTLAGYLLTAAALLLVAGALADRYGRRRVLVTGLLVMLVASVLCAVAPSFPVLITARIIQGVGAALVVPSSLALLNGTLRQEDRAPGIGVWAGLATVLLYGALAAAGYLIVLRCELTLGYTAAQAGAVLIPSSVIFLGLSPVSGRLAARIGPRWLMTAGILTVAGGLLWWGYADSGEYAVAILPGAVLWGIGLGLTVTPLTAAVLASAPEADLGEASAISDVAARLGGAVMIALVPALIGVQAGRNLADGLMHGYQQSMVILSGLCVVAAVISGIFVRSSRTAPPRFAPPAPYHGALCPTRAPASARSPIPCGRRSRRDVPDVRPSSSTVLGPLLSLADRPGRVDESYVAERLREVAQQLPGVRVDLLGQQADVVDVSGGPLEHLTGALHAAGHRQGLRQPEGAQQERAFLTGQPVDAALGAVPVDQPALVSESVGDRVDGG
jgi:MFS family permease